VIATEGALWGSIKAHGFLPNTVIVSDDSGQFDVGLQPCAGFTQKASCHPLASDNSRPNRLLASAGASRALQDRSRQDDGAPPILSEWAAR
jgi:hypothetical protein